MSNLTIPALRQLRNSEFIRYAKNVVTICEQNNASALLIQPQVQQLAATFTELDALFAPERGNVLTADVQALDERRDKAITGIRIHAESYLYHFNTEMARAAQLVLATIDRYGKNLARLNYIAETEVITSLVDDFRANAELVAAVQTLALQDWVQEMDTANKQFNGLYLARTGSYAAQPQGNLAELRLMVMEKYRALADNIFARMVLTPSPALDKLVAELNEITNQYNQLVANRTSGSEEDTPAATAADTAPASEV